MHLPKSIKAALTALTAAITIKRLGDFSADYDLWGHIFFGQEILRRHEITFADSYSFTAFGNSFVNHEWLSEITLALANGIGGEVGLFVWRVILTLLVLYTAWEIISISTSSAFARIVSWLCFVNVIAPGISFRPQIFSYLFTLIVIRNGIAARERDGPLPWLTLTVIFAIWANLHGAWPIGLIVWSIFIGENIFKKRHLRFLPLYALPFAATLLNPYGIDLYSYIFSEITNPINVEHITEWARFDFSGREVPFAIIAVISWFLVAKNSKYFQPTDTILLLIGTALGISAVRHTPIFAILSLPSISRNLGYIFSSIRNNQSSVAGRAHRIFESVTVGGIYTIACLFLYIGLPTRIGITPLGDTLPEATVKVIENTGFVGKLFVPLHWGSYTLFHLYPAVKVSIDARWATVYPRPVMKDNMRFSYEGTHGAWKEILNQYNADGAIIERDNPAISEMIKDRNWKFIAFEEDAGLLIKRELADRFKPLYHKDIHPPEYWPY